MQRLERLGVVGGGLMGSGIAEVFARADVSVVVCEVDRVSYSEFEEPLYAPPPLLARMVEAGLFGRKSGRGFYDDGRSAT